MEICQNTTLYIDVTNNNILAATKRKYIKARPVKLPKIRGQKYVGTITKTYLLTVFLYPYNVSRNNVIY